MTALRRYGLVGVTVLALAGCGHSTSSTYEAADVGRTIETTRGQVVSSRPVDIAGESNVVGPAAGAALGGAGAAGAFGSGWITIIGAVVGAGAGYAAQQIGNSRDGIEYIVQMEDGRTVTLVQNKASGEVAIANGTPVLVQISGKYTRVVPDPRSDAPRPLPAGAPAAGHVRLGRSGCGARRQRFDRRPAGPAGAGRHRHLWRHPRRNLQRPAGDRLRSVLRQPTLAGLEAGGGSRRPRWCRHPWIRGACHHPHTEIRPPDTCRAGCLRRYLGPDACRPYSRHRSSPGRSQYLPQ